MMSNQSVDWSSAVALVLSGHINLLPLHLSVIILLICLDEITTAKRNIVNKHY